MNSNIRIIYVKVAQLKKDCYIKPAGLNKSSDILTNSLGKD